jgi:hypothetical protein
MSSDTLLQELENLVVEQLTLAGELELLTEIIENTAGFSLIPSQEIAS